MAVALRTHQKLGVQLIREAYKTFRRVLFVAPTAFGKTVTFSSIAQSASALGRRIIIVAHRQELISQISKTLSRFDVEHGLIAPQYSPNYRKAVQVASIGTLRARMKKGKIPEAYAKFDLLIVDESHHMMADNTFGEVYRMLGEPRMLGVTATPQRGDGKGLGEEVGGLFQTLIEVINVRQLIEGGYLSNFKIYGPDPADAVDVRDVKVLGGDYEKKSLAEKVNKPKIIGNAVREYSRICPGAPAVVFCVSIAHCENVAQAFRDAGWRFEVIDGSMTDEKRKDLIDGLGDGRYHGLVSCDVISEGTDIPAITCAIFLRPTKSLGLFIQQAGRALRTIFADGFDLDTQEGRLAAIAASPKPYAILIDHANLTETHGFIDDEREWSLAGKKRQKGAKKKEPDEKLRFLQCPKCRTIHEIAPACPTCQHEYPVEEQSAGGGRTVEEVEGNLREIDREKARAARQQQRRDQGKAQSVEDMVRDLGYSRGRAEKVLKAREEKAEMVDNLVADLKLWFEKTGQSIPETFGVKTFDVPRMKPAQIRELQKRVDDHFAVWHAVSPNQEQAAIEF